MGWLRSLPGRRGAGGDCCRRRTRLRACRPVGFGAARRTARSGAILARWRIAMIGDVNRAKLYYLRGRVGKKARVRELRQN